jgi:hypothetical protein
MKVLQAATIYLSWVRYAQDTTTTTTSTSTDDAIKQLNELATKLFIQRPTQKPTKDNLRNPMEGLFATLYQEVDKMDYREEYPISRPESKSAVRTMVNDGRKFYIDLANSIDVSTLLSEFQKVINEWTSFKTSYLNDSMFNQMEQDKSAASADTADDWETRRLFWKQILNIIDSVMTQVYNMLKDQSTGNSETPLESEPI